MAQAVRSPRYRGRRIAEAQHITRSDLFLHPRHFRGRHHAAAIFVIVVLAVFGSRLFPSRNVTVIHDGGAFNVQATFDTRSEALAAAAVSLNPGDRIFQATGGDYASLAIQRARPVTVEVDGRFARLNTTAATVGGALAAAGVTLQPGDSVYLDSKLTTSRGPLAGAPATGDGLALAVVRARPVTVMIDTLRVERMSSAATVDALLQELGMTVREGDLVRPALTSPLSSGLTVRLAKARTITVRLDGKEQSLYTQAQTVADVLSVLGVDPGPEETLNPPRDTYVSNGLVITIGLTRIVDEEVQEKIAPRVVYETDPNLASESVREVPGSEGLRLMKYRVTYKNGAETDRFQVDSGTILVEAVPTRHITGTKGSHPKPILTSPEFNGTYSRKVTVRATWYNAAGGWWAPGDPNYGRTATGVFVDKGICAVDPDFISLGTRFFVPGYGPCLAADTGGAVKGNVIDLGYPESAGDPGWGNKYVEIYILD